MSLWKRYLRWSISRWGSFGPMIPLGITWMSLVALFALGLFFQSLETEQTRRAYVALSEARAGDILVMTDDTYLEVLEERAPGHLIVDELGWGNERVHLHIHRLPVRNRFVCIVKAGNPNNNSIRILNERRM